MSKEMENMEEKIEGQSAPQEAPEPNGDAPVAETPKEEPAKEEVKEEFVGEGKEKEDEEPAKKKAKRPKGKEKSEAKTEEAEVKAEEAAGSGDRKWYVVQAYSGQEDRVKDSIERNISNTNMQHKIFKVLVPTEDTVELKDGKRIEKVRKMFPGYVFIDMALDDETWYVIRGTTGVAKFIGSKVRPTPVMDKEMQRVLKQIGVKAEKLEVSFERGEAVRIISGPFRGYTGSIDEINAQKGKLKTLISIFGRDTPVEVNFEQVQKIV